MVEKKLEDLKFLKEILYRAEEVIVSTFGKGTVKGEALRIGDRTAIVKWVAIFHAPFPTTRTGEDCNRCEEHEKVDSINWT